MLLQNPKCCYVKRRQATSSNVKQCQATSSNVKQKETFRAIPGHYGHSRLFCTKAQVLKGPSAQRPKCPKAQVPKDPSARNRSQKEQKQMKTKKDPKKPKRR